MRAFIATVDGMRPFSRIWAISEVDLPMLLAMAASRLMPTLASCIMSWPMRRPVLLIWPLTKATVCMASPPRPVAAAQLRVASVRRWAVMTPAA